MPSLKTRLALGVLTLEFIDRRRAEKRQPQLGLAAEHILLQRELDDLERVSYGRAE